MLNTSATGGPLLPDGVIPPPLEDEALDRFMHDFFFGVGGYTDPTLVRPRWQIDTPDLPARSVDWLGVGITKRPGDAFPAIVHDGAAAAGAGADVLYRNELLDILLSFYGPNCQGLAALVRDGLMVPQNLEPLFLANMGLVEAKDLTKNPEVIKGAWYARVDLPVVISRQIIREYPVRNLLTAQATLNAPQAPVHNIDTTQGPRP